MVWSSSEISSGFSSKAPTPALRAVNNWFGRAVMMMIGVNGFSAVSRSKVSQPFFTGMLRSSKTRSTSEAEIMSSASCPSLAGNTT